MSEPQIRLLICFEDKTIEPLADYEGNPDHDVELAALIARHETAGIRHHGNVVKVPEAEWGLREKREQILEQINKGLNGGETGLGSDAYQMVDTFKHDAMECFGKHNRNPACPDYKSESKRLIPNTAAERKELGLVAARDYDREGGQKTIYLCDYCPVHSLVQQAARKKAGLYNK